MSIHTSSFFMQNCRNFTEALALSLSLSLSPLRQRKQKTRRRRDLAGIREPHSETRGDLVEVTGSLVTGTPEKRTTS